MRSSCKRPTPLYRNDALMDMFTNGHASHRTATDLSKMCSLRRVFTSSIKANKLAKTYFSTSSPLHKVKQQKEGIVSVDILGKIEDYPVVWLRENCQCDKCFMSSAQSRIIDWSSFRVDSKPKIISETEDGFRIVWDDGHESKFDYDWLSIRSFDPKEQDKYKNSMYRLKKQVWHGKTFDAIRSAFDFNAVMNKEEELFKFLEKLIIYGVALLENAPRMEDVSNELVNKIGFRKETHYGKSFIVQNVANTSNVAYLSSNLQLHTDLPYYAYAPGVNFLHCLEQTSGEGGENLLADSFHTAKYIKDNHPKEYELLSTVDVEWTDIGVENGMEFYKLHRSPVICEDRFGEVESIKFSVPQRGSHFTDSIDKVKPWYDAHKLFYDLSMEFAAKFKTKPGHILVFDNIRLVHGRTQYEDRSDNVRKIIGNYMDWDEIFSKYRCLKMRLAK